MSDLMTMQNQLFGEYVRLKDLRLIGPLSDHDEEAFTELAAVLGEFGVGIEPELREEMMVEGSSIFPGNGGEVK